MSLLDSACRIGHRKYLLNELIMRLRKHTTLFRLKFFRRRSGRNGFANSSILGHLGSFRSLRDPRSTGRLESPLDSWIVRFPGCFDFSKAKDSLEASRSIGSRDHWIPDSLDERDREFLTSLNSDIQEYRGSSWSPQIFRSLYTNSRMIYDRLYDDATSGHLHKNAIEESRSADPL